MYEQVSSFYLIYLIWNTCWFYYTWISLICVFCYICKVKNRFLKWCECHSFNQNNLLQHFCKHYSAAGCKLNFFKNIGEPQSKFMSFRFSKDCDLSRATLSLAASSYFIMCPFSMWFQHQYDSLLYPQNLQDTFNLNATLIQFTVVYQLSETKTTWNSCVK